MTAWLQVGKSMWHGAGTIILCVSTRHGCKGKVCQGSNGSSLYRGVCVSGHGGHHAVNMTHSSRSTRLCELQHLKQGHAATGQHQHACEHLVGEGLSCLQPPSPSWHSKSVSDMQGSSQAYVRCSLPWIYTKSCVDQALPSFTGPQILSRMLPVASHDHACGSPACFMCLHQALSSPRPWRPFPDVASDHITRPSTQLSFLPPAPCTRHRLRKTRAPIPSWCASDLTPSSCHAPVPAPSLPFPQRATILRCCMRL